MKISRLLFAVAAIGISSTTASAQRVEGSQAGIPRVNLVSANPIGLLFEWYNGEFEHAVNSTASLGVAASRFEFDGPTYTSIDGIARYYPSGRAVRGFSFGISVGLVDVDADCSDFCSDEDGTSATVGVRGDYVWILGRDQRFSVATGIGAKRLINDDLGTEGLPIGRLSIGYAW